MVWVTIQEFFDYHFFSIHLTILSSCLFNLYAEDVMRNELDEAQVGIKIAGRNINNLRYADNTTLMAESKEELKSLLKEENEKVGLKLNLQKTKVMAIGQSFNFFIANFDGYVNFLVL